MKSKYPKTKLVFTTVLEKSLIARKYKMKGGSK
jgi:hypothetical protein